MKYFDWNKKKNDQLKKERDISFEDIVVAIQEERLVDIIEQQNKKNYPNQKMFIVEVNQYIYVVPFVEDEEKYFLKTIFPSRKMTRKYLKGGE